MLFSFRPHESPFLASSVACKNPLLLAVRLYYCCHPVRKNRVRNTTNLRKVTSNSPPVYYPVHPQFTTKFRVLFASILHPVCRRNTLSDGKPAINRPKHSTGGIMAVDWWKIPSLGISRSGFLVPGFSGFLTRRTPLAPGRSNTERRDGKARSWLHPIN